MKILIKVIDVVVRDNSLANQFDYVEYCFLDQATLLERRLIDMIKQFFSYLSHQSCTVEVISL